MPEPRRVKLILEMTDDPQPGVKGDFVRRLKRLLKWLLRGYGFRCHWVEEIKEEKEK